MDRIGTVVGAGRIRRPLFPRSIFGYNAMTHLVAPVDQLLVAGGAFSDNPDLLMDSRLFRLGTKMSIVPGELLEGVDFVRLAPHSVVTQALHDLYAPTLDVPPDLWRKGGGGLSTMDHWLELAGCDPARWSLDPEGNPRRDTQGRFLPDGAIPGIGALVRRILQLHPHWLPLDGDFHGVSPYFAAYRIHDPEAAALPTLNTALGDGLAIPTAVPPFQMGHGHPAYREGFRWDVSLEFSPAMMPLDPMWSFGAKRSLMPFHQEAMDWTWGLLRDAEGRICMVVETGNGLGVTILDAGFFARVTAGLVGPALIAKAETAPPAHFYGGSLDWTHRPELGPAVRTLGVDPLDAEVIAQAIARTRMAADLIQRPALKRARRLIALPSEMTPAPGGELQAHDVFRPTLTAAKGFRCLEVGLTTGRRTILTGQRPGWAEAWEAWHGIPNGIHGPFPLGNGTEVTLVADIDAPGFAIDLAILGESDDFGLFRLARPQAAFGPEADGPTLSWRPGDTTRMAATRESVLARIRAGELAATAPWRLDATFPKPSAVDFRVVLVLARRAADGATEHDARVSRAGLIRAWRGRAPKGDALAQILFGAGGAWDAIEGEVDLLARTHLTLRQHEDRTDHPQGRVPPDLADMWDRVQAVKAGYPALWCERFRDGLRLALRKASPSQADGPDWAAAAFWGVFEGPTHLEVPHPFVFPYEPVLVTRWMEWLPLARIQHLWGILWRGYALGRYLTRPETVLETFMGTHATVEAWTAFWGEAARLETGAADAGFWLSKGHWWALEPRLFEAVTDPEVRAPRRFALRADLVALREALPPAVRAASTHAEALLAARVSHGHGVAPAQGGGVKARLTAFGKAATAWVGARLPNGKGS
jgi:hypothetical protein